MSFESFPKDFSASDELAVVLFNLISASSSLDRKKLQEYGDITRAFFSKDDPFEGSSLDGYAMELYLWIGLKLDAPELADSYERSIQETWPRLFPSKRDTSVA
ncbi:hypothetical protein [Frankia sp. R43]|uniref:hypothetical protein n=1 Tax=Frankia sp. R43 TaxID=269536 RepID=UPI00128F5ECB|nr:hypothetical protein [Frankia sp. R43]